MRFVAVAIVTSAFGCAHRPAWQAAEHRLCDGKKMCYRVGPLGGDWRLVHQEGAAVGFYSDSIGGVVEANATCRDDAEAAPLEALTRQLLIGYTDRAVIEKRLEQVDRREALHTLAEARIDGVPVLLNLYVLKRNGCVFDLSYVAPPGRYRRGEGDFARFVDGFVDLRGS
jgi:hypothetical protein